MAGNVSKVLQCQRIPPPNQNPENVLQSLPPRPHNSSSEVAAAVPPLTDRHSSFGPLVTSLVLIVSSNLRSYPSIQLVVNQNISNSRHISALSFDKYHFHRLTTPENLAR